MDRMSERASARGREEGEQEERGYYCLWLDAGIPSGRVLKHKAKAPAPGAAAGMSRFNNKGQIILIWAPLPPKGASAQIWERVVPGGGKREGRE